MLEAALFSRKLAYNFWFFDFCITFYVKSGSESGTGTAKAKSCGSYGSRFTTLQWPPHEFFLQISGPCIRSLRRFINLEKICYEPVQWWGFCTISLLYTVTVKGEKIQCLVRQQEDTRHYHFATITRKCLLHKRKKSTQISLFWLYAQTSILPHDFLRSWSVEIELFDPSCILYSSWLMGRK